MLDTAQWNYKGKYVSQGDELIYLPHSAGKARVHLNWNEGDSVDKMPHALLHLERAVASFYAAETLLRTTTVFVSRYSLG